MANDLVTQVSGAVQRMPSSRRALLVGGLAIVAAAVIGVGMWASQPAWVVLYGGVSLGDAALMTDALEKAGLRNRLGSDGSSVMVAKEDYARARVLLAKSELPAGGHKGYEVLDGKSDWGVTDFMQRVNYQRALEGELARSISGTTGVERADVHLTIPEPTALRRADRPAKAAVRLRMRSGMILAPGAVQGIIATVSNSVDRLSPENVVITDETGRLLSGPSDDGSLLGGASRRMEMQQSIENYLAGKAERLLETVAGLGRPRVQVSASLNFDQVERTIESFDPDGQVLTAEGRSETEATAEGGGAQTIVNNTYQNSRRLEKMLSAGGGVTRLTVSVLLDERAIQADTASRTPVADRIASVDALVRNAVGYDSVRGDRLTVRAVPFEVIPIDTVAAAPPRDLLGLVERFARPAIGLVAIIALLIVALKTIKALQPTRAPGTAASRAQLAPSIENTVPPLGPPPETVLLKNRVVEETQQRPELMAQAVRAWMAEGTNQ